MPFDTSKPLKRVAKQSCAHQKRQLPRSRAHVLAADVDWLVSVAPGGAETHHAINADVLKALGPEGRVFNIGRGSVIDEVALVTALKSGDIAGAALDVFENEPNPHLELLTMPNVLLQPHNGSATHVTRQAMGQLVVDNAKAHVAGEPLLTEIV